MSVQITSGSSLDAIAVTDPSGATTQLRPAYTTDSRSIPTLSAAAIHTPFSKARMEIKYSGWRFDSEAGSLPVATQAVGSRISRAPPTASDRAISGMRASAHTNMPINPA